MAQSLSHWMVTLDCVAVRMPVEEVFAINHYMWIKCSVINPVLTTL